MASEVKIKQRNLHNQSAMIFLLIGCILIGIVECQQQARLEIFPTPSVQRKPVGKPHMLTCRLNVPDANLVTDLQWRDYNNLTVLPKQNGQTTPPMYTETLPDGQSMALIISNLMETMAGMYYCSASYANTELLEIGVKIETYIAITWKDAPENQYTILGTDYNVRCEVTASPPPTVDWLRNGDPIKTGGRYVVETHGLLIRNIQESDDGIYTCRAAVIQTGELVERNIRVEVQIKPIVDKLPVSVEAIEGQSFSIICNATGKPVPEFTWIKQTTQQNVAMADRFLVNALNGQMSITRVEKDDYGTFTCVAKNSAGVSESRMLLDVLVRPKIYEFYNITVAINDEGSFTCRATGRPAPEITFRRWGSQEELVPGTQPGDDRLLLEQTKDEQIGESSGTLRITKYVRSDDGLYECVARNRGDTAYKVGHITIEFPPSFDHMKDLPPVYSWEERRVNLTCLAEGIPNATIEWRLNDRLVKDLLDQYLVVEGSGPRSDLIVTPVDRRYYTAYKCIAVNKHGRSEHVMELREARVPDVVVSAQARVVTATTITFDLIGPPTELGLPITAYSVQYKEQLNPDWVLAFNRTWSPESPYIVEGLRPQTGYNFRFAARNQVGLGQFGAYVIQTTPRRSAPEEPRTLLTPVQGGSDEDDDDDPIFISPYGDFFELRWSVPADNGEPIDYYQIKYCPGMKINGEFHAAADQCASIDVRQTETNFEMRDLQADTYYSIELRAHNAIGFSTPAYLMLKTARGSDVVLRVDQPLLSSVAIIGIAVGGVLLLLILVDLICCFTVNAGLLATMCRRTKRSPSDLDDETKIGSLYGWRFPLPYCSGNLVKEPPPSPLPLPPPVKLGGTPLTTPLEEREPLNSLPAGPGGMIMKNNSSVEFDGRVVHSRSGDIIGKNSAV